MADARKSKETEPKNGKSRTSEEAYEAWRAFFQDMSEEGAEFYQRGVEMFQRMTPLYPGSEVFKEWMDNYSQFVSRVTEETTTKSTSPMDAYRRVYDAWLDTWTRNFESYMRTPEFVARSGKDLETFSELNKKVGEMMEAYWHAMHLPTQGDLTEVYHKLYTIDRKLDELTMLVKSSQASASSTASAKKSKK